MNNPYVPLRKGETFLVINTMTNTIHSSWDTFYDAAISAEDLNKWYNQRLLIPPKEASLPSNVIPFRRKR